MKPKFFTETEVEKILNAIRAAEKMTSGEIRVHVENRCWRKSMLRAALIFKRLKLDRTKLRNGVLIYLAVKSHKFAILGDQAIYTKFAPDIWNNIKEAMRPYFLKNQFCDGLCLGIQQIGGLLQTAFPYQSDDVNELSDEISVG
ncbi:TPM domain-containing protein [candidate division KSB1 bacterium]|nr:TPM domain-containing protein [candidate division KSB1 bacterium]